MLLAFTSPSSAFSFKQFSPLWEASYLGDNLTLNNSLVLGTLVTRRLVLPSEKTHRHTCPLQSEFAALQQFCGDERGLEHSWNVGTQAQGSS